jgi:hypothetical protein
MSIRSTAAGNIHLFFSLSLGFSSIFPFLFLFSAVSQVAGLMAFSFLVLVSAISIILLLRKPLLARLHFLVSNSSTAVRDRKGKEKKDGL